MSDTNRLTRCGGRVAAAMIVVTVAACVPGPDNVPQVRGGDAERGRVALVRYQCGVCHVVPGIEAAVGQVGPALDEYSSRPYVAGKFPNEPETLVRWILDPPVMAPQTAMPAIPMSERDARDMAAYLYEAE